MMNLNQPALDSAQTALTQIDSSNLKSEYFNQDELLYLHDFAPPSLMEALVQEMKQLEPLVNRNYVPGFKKGGSVDYYKVQEHAPTLSALYHHPMMCEFVEKITGEKVSICPQDDPHSCALYYYSEAGDRIGYHYDTSHYKGKRYTLLLSLYDDSTARLKCEMFRKNKTRPVQKLDLQTHPGTLVLFNGDNIYHAVSEISEGQKRVMVTMEFVTSTEMGWVGRMISNVKDAYAYFGFRSLFQKKRPPATAS